MTEFITDYNCSNPENRELLRTFLKKSWLETYPEQVGMTVTSNMIATIMSNDLGGIVPSENGRIITAMKQDKLVGSCVHLTRHKTTYVWGVYVRRSEQRTGIGRAMLEFVIKAMPRCNRIQITVLQKSNDAIRFYKSMGFIVVSKEDFQLTAEHREPAYVLEYIGDSNVSESVGNGKIGKLT